MPVIIMPEKCFSPIDYFLGSKYSWKKIKALCLTESSYERMKQDLHIRRDSSYIGNLEKWVREEKVYNDKYYPCLTFFIDKYSKFGKIYVKRIENSNSIIEFNNSSCNALTIDY